MDFIGVWPLSRDEMLPLPWHINSENGILAIFSHFSEAASYEQGGKCARVHVPGWAV